jgi:hypothetical protein
MPATDRNPAPFGQEGSRIFWMVTWNIINRRGGEIDTGGHWIGANEDRGSGTDGVKIC